MKYKKLFQCVHGSHLYGLNTPESDIDYKGVFMPSTDELLLGISPKQISESTGNDQSKNTSEDVDSDWYSLPEFIRLCTQGEMIALDMLHASPMQGQISASPEWEFIQMNRWRFSTKNMKAFLGYARKQASKYGIKGSRMAALEEVFNQLQRNDYYLKYDSWDKCDKISEYVWGKLPENDHCYYETTKMKNGTEQEFYVVLGSKYQKTMPLPLFLTSIKEKWNSYGERAKAAKENKGVDWKAVSHALRAGYQLKEIYEEGTITYPLKNKDFLLAVKQGTLDFLTEVQPVLEELIDEVEVLADRSDFPEKVDSKFWDDFLLSCYKG